MLGLGFIAVAAGLGGASGCLDRPVGALTPETTNIIVDKISQTGVDKIDLLFMVDNSISMADKQEILQAAVPDLVSRLVSPVCVDAEGVQQAAQTPTDPTADCPAGLGREFQPIANINIGVITSSLGGFGAENSQCTAASSVESVDMANLLGALPRGKEKLAGSTNVNAAGLGFLEWRAGKMSDSFSTDFGVMVGVSGENGCGYEASLEAWYRFLIDPKPFAELTRVPCSANTTDANCVSASGLDQAILDQRAAFLRPDSLVAVIMLTDENDCSIRMGGQAWYVADKETRQFTSSSVCDTMPNDSCCYSCGQKPPAGCAPDANCADANSFKDATDKLSPALDELNLRCFQQKKRFGVDFLYPTARYVNALSKPKLCLHSSRADLNADNCPEGGEIVDNPLYAAPADGSALPRDSSLVFLAGIVGVPWQDIATDVSSETLTYKTFANLPWDTILSDGYTPGDPLMIESVAPRSGTNPITNDELQPITAAEALANPINGHEWEPTDDLQYACIFPLKQKRDCGALPADSDQGCDCIPTGDDPAEQKSSPLCQSPETGAYGAEQYFAKAYPGIRHLQTLKDFGDITGNSVVASICARNVSDPTRQDFGYRPAIGAIVDRLKEQLIDRCLPRPLAVTEGKVPCSIIEARPKRGDTCACTNTARAEINPEIRPLVQQRLEENSLCEGDACNNFCLCEVQSVYDATPGGAAEKLASEEDCQDHEATQGSTNGWCYIDAEKGIGSADLVAKCPATAQRKLRFVGEGKLENGTTTFVACIGDSLRGAE